MGINGLFPWISKRFPGISKLLNSKLFNFKVDYFFVDFNYLIYNCISFINDDDKQLLIKQTLILLDDIIKIISPKKLLFISVDGVSPFAKIFEQRKRRFSGNMHPTKINQNKSFSKCNITVGTEFVELMHQNLFQFLESIKKNSNIEHIVYSSYHSPGEGEYKIFNFIREQIHNNKWNSEFNSFFLTPDSDVIISILLNHINHSFIMKNIQKTNEREYSFVLWDISLLEQLILEYFDFKKDSDKKKIVIDDFCKISLFLGNDFLPKFPDFSLYREDFDTALSLYKEKFINSGTNLLDNLSIYLSELSLICSQKSNPTLTKELCEKYALINFFKKKDPNLDENEKERLILQVCYSALDCFYWTFSYFSKTCLSWQFYYPYDYSPSLILISKYCNSYQLSFNIGKIPSPFESLISIIPFNHIHLLPNSLQSNCLLNDEIMKIMKGNARSITINSLEEIRKVIKESEKQMNDEEKKRNLILDEFLF